MSVYLYVMPDQVYMCAVFATQPDSCASQGQDVFIATLSRLLDADDLEDSPASEQVVAEIVKDLHTLSDFPVTVELLNDTDAGEQISYLESEHSDQRVREAAQATLKAWRASMLNTQLGSHLQNRGNVFIPSSNCSGLKGVYGKDYNSCDGGELHPE